MVQLIFEDSLNLFINDLIKTKTLQVGLIIGQFTANSKDFAIHFAKCPNPVDDEVEEELVNSDSENTKINEKIKQKNEAFKLNSNENIDVKWIVEHARQVTRMLTGGLMIIGVYYSCSPEIYLKNQALLRQCLYSVRKKSENSKWIRNSIPHNERYFFHMCTLTGKLSCRTIDINDVQGSFKQATFRFQSFLSSWHSFSCFVDVNISSYVPVKESLKTEQKMTYACHDEIESIWNSYASINFKIVKDDQLISENTKNKNTNKTKTTKKDIEIMLFKKNVSNNVLFSPDQINTEIKFVGSIFAKAFIHQKGTYGEAVKALKVDIIRSLQSRIELLCEEAQINNLCQVNEWSLMSPIRVFVKAYEVYYCDYAFKDETQKETISRFLDLLGINPSQNDLIYMEKSPDISDVSMILRGERPVDIHSEMGSERSSICLEEPSNFKFLASCIIALVAVVFSFIVILLKQ
ncbi:protein odr-4 homolog [Hydra vulgaris]|uniref:protein odr-4 homolog n=1 Tax=Hydra vulgaris TaxID=6087 RepID=UPI001F5EC9A9|nr:protein odr-4 homolog [Hydra vulgaris]